MFSLQTVTAVLATLSYTQALPTNPPQAASLASLFAAAFPSGTVLAPDFTKTLGVFYGIGTQNYTCVNNKPSQTVAGSGATAQLFDVTTIAQNGAALLSSADTSLRGFTPSTLSAQQDGSFNTIQIQGYHHFSASSKPVFEFPFLGVRFDGTAVTSVPTPNGGVGPDGFPAINWVHLVSNAGAGDIYRVNTNGGMPIDESGNIITECKTGDALPRSVYGAEYWVFAP